MSITYSLRPWIAFFVALFVVVFSGVRVTLVLCACFVDCCLSFCTFSFCHCVICSSSIYGFWLPLWYLQTLLVFNESLFLSIFCMPYSDDLSKRFDSIISIVCLLADNIWNTLWYEKYENGTELWKKRIFNTLFPSTLYTFGWQNFGKTCKLPY